MTQLSIQEAIEIVAETLSNAGAHALMADSTAQALVLAESQGLGSHGLSRVLQYAAQLKNGRVDGRALARVSKRKGAALVVDAHEGLAFPACELAISEGIAAAQTQGLAIVGVCNSHHAGVMVDHLRPAAQAGLIGLAMSNSPAAMPMAGGKQGLFGTNPIAAIFPRQGAAALMIDLSLSEVARGKLMVAAKEGRSIPLGWALDSDGNPTTDPSAGLKGTMLPIGAATSAKGAMLALVVELLVTALIGSQFGYEADSFFVDEGNRPRLGQLFLLIDPAAFAGREHFYQRIEVFLAQMCLDSEVRLPGERREALRKQATAQGLNVPDALIAQWKTF
jgi:(2R)-3-sulfolactate dehydrogenase (NADP+)